MLKSIEVSSATSRYVYEMTFLREAQEVVELAAGGAIPHSRNRVIREVYGSWSGTRAYQNYNVRKHVRKMVRSTLEG